VHQTQKVDLRLESNGYAVPSGAEETGAIPGKTPVSVYGAALMWNINACPAAASMASFRVMY
jgi:hypothetical protein